MRIGGQQPSGSDDTINKPQQAELLDIASFGVRQSPLRFDRILMIRAVDSCAVIDVAISERQVHPNE
jgi:hypothetical protein